MIKSKDIKGEIELERLRHNNKMEEIKFEITGKISLEKLKHEHDMENQRIKSADIKRTLMQKKYG